jgi:tetratricopeptide (TPR) repeat protein
MTTLPDRSRLVRVWLICLFLISIAASTSVAQGELRRGASGSGDGPELRLPNPPAKRRAASGSPKPTSLNRTRSGKTAQNPNQASTPVPPVENQTNDLVDEEITLANAARDRGNAKLDGAIESGDDARVRESQREYNSARDHYLKASQIDPSDYRPYFGLGAIYIDQKQRNLTTSHEEAAKNFQAAIDRNPTSAESYVGLSYATAQLRNYDQSIAASQKAISLRPDYAEAYYTLGSAYYLGDREEEAIPAFQKAIALKPNYDRAYRVLGNVYLSLKRHEDRINNFKLWVKNSPQNPEAHLNLGSGYYSGERYNEAVATFKHVLTLKPDWVTVHYQLGLSYYRLGNDKAVQEQYEILKRLDPESAGYFHKLVNR